jgi:hypothetical protein
MARFTHSQMVTAFAGALAEWLFAALPLVVVALVMADLGKFHHLFESPEWAFGSAILAGQALLRYVSGFARSRNTPLDRVLFGAAILVIAAVPTYTVLVLVLSKELSGHHLPRFLIVSQVLLFFAASLSYVLVSVAAILNRFPTDLASEIPPTRTQGMINRKVGGTHD